MLQQNKHNHYHLNGYLEFFYHKFQYHNQYVVYTNAKSITSGEWSVPSHLAIAAFGGELGITRSNYSGYGLKACYWSSSAYSNFNGYYVSFSPVEIDHAIGYYFYPVRLARTF